MTLEANKTCLVAGRECLKIRAVQIPGTQLWPHWLAWEATEYEFAADLERAVLLSIVGLVEGEAIETHEVVAVNFDEVIDDSLFTYKAEVGEIIQPAVPIVEFITAEAAACRAPFTILTPIYVPESQRVLSETMYHPARPNSPAESFSIHYRGGETFDYLSIEQRQKRDEKHDELEWDELDVEGRRLDLSDPGVEGFRILAFEQDGTYVDIISDLPRDELVKIALSLKPVSAS